MTDTVLAEAARRIGEDKELEERALINGVDDDYAKYRQRVGVVAGLTKALNTIENFQKDLDRHGTGTDT